MKKITGALTAVVTPFETDGNVDVKALKKLVQFQIKNGIAGIVPCGSTGEAATLTLEEYRLVVETVVKEVAGQVYVIAGATHNDTSRAIELSIIAKKAGADGLLHATPYYNKPTLTGLIAHYKAIAANANLPIILYNVPGRTGLNLTSDMTLTLAKEISHVVGIKEASANIVQIMDVIKRAPTDFSILSGDDAFTFSIMALGGHGIISVAANEIPKEIAALTTAALEGDWKKARKIHYEWLDLMHINFIESNPQPVKTALFLMGKIKEVFRLPLVPMQDKSKETLKKVLKGHNLT